MVFFGSPDNPLEHDDSLSTTDDGMIVIDSSSEDEADPAQAHVYMPLAQAALDLTASDSETTDSDGADSDVEIIKEIPAPPKIPVVSESTIRSPSIVGKTAQTGGPSTSSEDDVIVIDDDDDEPNNQNGIPEIWASRRADPGVPLNSEQVNEVKAAMADFELPPSSIPTWATAVPEEEWREKLLDHIHMLQGSPRK